jgi:hypothetical protein
MADRGGQDGASPSGRAAGCFGVSTVAAFIAAAGIAAAGIAAVGIAMAGQVSSGEPGDLAARKALKIRRKHAVPPRMRGSRPFSSIRCLWIIGVGSTGHRSSGIFEKW